MGYVLSCIEPQSWQPDCGLSNICFIEGNLGCVVSDKGALISNRWNWPAACFLFGCFKVERRANFEFWDFCSRWFFVTLESFPTHFRIQISKMANKRRQCVHVWWCGYFARFNFSVTSCDRKISSGCEKMCAWPIQVSKLFAFPLSFPFVFNHGAVMWFKVQQWW